MKKENTEGSWVTMKESGVGEKVFIESEYASMEKDQLISMIHFLEKRVEARKKENEDFKELLHGKVFHHI